MNRHLLNKYFWIFFVAFCFWCIGTMNAQAVSLERIRYNEVPTYPIFYLDLDGATAFRELHQNESSLRILLYNTQFDSVGMANPHYVNNDFVSMITMKSISEGLVLDFVLDAKPLDYRLYMLKKPSRLVVEFHFAPSKSDVVEKELGAPIPLEDPDILTREYMQKPPEPYIPPADVFRDTSDYMMAEADSMFLQGHYNRAEQILHDIELEFPQTSFREQIAVLRAKIADKRGEKNIALNRYQRALEDFPEMAEAVFVKGRIGFLLYEQGDWEASLPYLRAFIPYQDRATKIDIYWMIVEIYYRDHEWVTVRHLLLELPKKLAVTPTYQNRYFRYLTEAELAIGQPLRAILYFQKIKGDEISDSLRYRIGDIYYQNRNYEKALNLFLALSKNDELLEKIARSYYYLGRYRETVNTLKKMHHLNAELVSIARDSFFRLQAFTDGIAFMQQYDAQSTDLIEFYYQNQNYSQAKELAEVMFDQGDEEALPWLVQTLAETGSYEGIWQKREIIESLDMDAEQKSYLLYQLAFAAYKRNDYQTVKTLVNTLMKTMADQFWSQKAMELKQNVQFIESISEQFPISSAP